MGSVDVVVEVETSSKEKGRRDPLKKDEGPELDAFLVEVENGH